MESKFPWIVIIEEKEPDVDIPFYPQEYEKLEDTDTKTLEMILEKGNIICLR
jgi:hypothetical protein